MRLTPPLILAVVALVALALGAATVAVICLAVAVLLQAVNGA
jgi:positive regulator of sigma E activity